MIEIHSEAWREAPGRLDPGHVLFAIGDTHGHAEHLSSLQSFIAERIRQTYSNERVTMVWLGDFIDRGPAPRETIDLARFGLGLEGVREVRLKGNHEQFLLDIVNAPNPESRDLLLWSMNGGRDTIEALVGHAEFRDLRDLAKALRKALGNERLNFLSELALSHRAGTYLCVHAGLNPARDLEHQREEDLLWIREPFLSPKFWNFGLYVIHGHSPQMPNVYGHRIAVDSGVYFSGCLTAVELRERELRFIMAIDDRYPDFDWGYVM